MFNLKSKTLKNKRGNGAVGTAIVILSSIVLGSIILMSTVGVTNNIVKPKVNAKVDSMYATETADAGGSGGGGGSGDTEDEEDISGYHMIVDGDSLNAVRIVDGANIDDVNWHEKVASALNLKFEVETNDSGIWYKDVMAMPWSMFTKNDAYTNLGGDIPQNIASASRISALINRAKEVEAQGDKVVIFVNGGTNDAIQWRAQGDNESLKVNIGTIDGAHDENTYYGALQLWLDKVKTEVPNAKIVFLGTPYNASHEGWDLKYEHKTSDAQPFRDAQKAVCQKYGVKYIDLFNLMNAGIDTDYYDDVTYENVRHYLNVDGIHYNTVAGSDEITRVIVSELGSH